MLMKQTLHVKAHYANGLCEQRPAHSAGKHFLVNEGAGGVAVHPWSAG